MQSSGLVTLLEDIWGPKGGPRWVCFVMGALWPVHILVFLGFFAHAMAKGQRDD